VAVKEVPQGSEPDCEKGKHTRWRIKMVSAFDTFIHQHSVQVCRNCGFEKELPCPTCIEHELARGGPPPKKKKKPTEDF